jgi:hypothetical protein
VVHRQVLPLHTPHTALQHAKLNRSSQKWNFGPVPPLDGILKLLGLPFFELLQLGHNPSAFFLHRSVHLTQGDPIGCTHHQAICSDREPNAFAARTLKTK